MRTYQIDFTESIRRQFGRFAIHMTEQLRGQATPAVDGVEDVVRMLLASQPVRDILRHSGKHDADLSVIIDATPLVVIGCIAIDEADAWHLLNLACMYAQELPISDAAMKEVLAGEAILDSLAKHVHMEHVRGLSLSGRMTLVAARGTWQTAAHYIGLLH